MTAPDRGGSTWLRCAAKSALPFLKEKAKRDILGGNAARLFKIDTSAGKLAKVA